MQTEPGLDRGEVRLPACRKTRGDQLSPQQLAGQFIDFLRINMSFRRFT